MIEHASEFGSSTATAPLTTGDTSLMSAGDMLRQAREAHGLHLEVVAAALKVPPQKLQALEEDRIADLPDPVFARALAASVARALRIDPAPVLAKLPGAKRPGLADADRTMSAGIRYGAGRGGSDGAWPLSKPLLTVVSLLLVAAAALIWLPQSLFDRVSGGFAQWSGRGGAEPPKAVAEEPAATPTAAGDTVANNAGAPHGAVPAASAPASTGTAFTGSASEATGARVQANAPAAATPAVAGGDMVSFTLHADSWIMVREAGGKVLLERPVKAGETVGASGKPPLSVVVGRASGVDVLVQGKPFNLAPVTRPGGVARFEVNP